jgi:hypothetical protein
MGFRGQVSWKALLKSNFTHLSTPTYTKKTRVFRNEFKPFQRDLEGHSLRVLDAGSLKEQKRLMKLLAVSVFSF